MQRAISQPDIIEIAPPAHHQDDHRRKHCISAHSGRTCYGNQDHFFRCHSLPYSSGTQRIGAAARRYTEPMDNKSRLCCPTVGIAAGQTVSSARATIAMSGAALMFVSSLLIIALGVPFYMRYQAFFRAKSHGSEYLGRPGNQLTARIGNDDQLTKSLPYLRYWI